MNHQAAMLLSHCSFITSQTELPTKYYITLILIEDKSCMVLFLFFFINKPDNFVPKYVIILHRIK